MINIVFHLNSGMIYGYDISGHSGWDEQGKDIICAAVSSAAYMTANTVTDIMHINAETFVDEGKMHIMINNMQDAKKAQIILQGFLLHVKELSNQYNDFIKIEISEV